MIIEDTESFENVFVSNYWYDADGERTVKTSGENEAIYVNPYLVAGQGGEYTKHIYIAALGESLFPSSLAFPRMAKVVSRMVWHFRAWQKLSLESLMFAYLVMKEGVVIQPYMTNITRLYITF